MNVSEKNDKDIFFQQNLKFSRKDAKDEKEKLSAFVRVNHELNSGIFLILIPDSVTVTIAPFLT